jgi:hypothetical protein
MVFGKTREVREDNQQVQEEDDFVDLGEEEDNDTQRHSQSQGNFDFQLLDYFHS